ncbi:MAG: SDR family oxidoreductase [Candidatus Sumerlaeia bacterium]|nr:SDR family oxidoreductase [Candidatus Sumerlaeia bacterium]
MKLLIAGATGQVGALAVAEALSEGHEVTALARNPARLEQGTAGKSPRLRTVAGDVLDRDAVRRAVAGQDALLLVFGAPLNLQTIANVPVVRTEATGHFIDAMKESGVRRLVVMTGIGAGDSRRSGRAIFRNVIRPLLLGRIYVDMDRQEQLVQASPLDWTIVRPAELTNGPALGNVRTITDYQREPASTISRSDVARFLVTCCASAALPKQCYVISS